MKHLNSSEAILITSNTKLLIRLAHLESVVKLCRSMIDCRRNLMQINTRKKDLGNLIKSGQSIMRNTIEHIRNTPMNFKKR